MSIEHRNVTGSQGFFPVVIEIRGKFVPLKNKDLKYENLKKKVKTTNTFL